MPYGHLNPHRSQIELLTATPNLVLLNSDKSMFILLGAGAPNLEVILSSFTHPLEQILLALLSEYIQHQLPLITSTVPILIQATSIFHVY